MTCGRNEAKAAYDAVVEENKALKAKIKKLKVARFKKPTAAEVATYMSSIGLKSKEEADKFVDFYATKGWKVGKNPMIDWEAAVRNWARGQAKETVARPQIDNEDPKLQAGKERLARELREVNQGMGMSVKERLSRGSNENA